MRECSKRIRDASTALVLACCLGATSQAVAQTKAPQTRFTITFPATAHSGPVTGRVFIIISRSDSMTRGATGRRVAAEPRDQTGLTGVPFFGRDISHLAPGQAATIDATDLGSPVPSLREIPAGDYFVQAVVNVYSEFHRADGHVVWMHNDQWEGQHFTSAPGNLVSDVQRVHIDPRAGYTIHLDASRVLLPVEMPPDTKWVKHIKIQSPLLTKFWGQPMYLGAIVLLPRDYETSTISYPVQYIQGHFSLAAPAGFAEDSSNAMYEAWTKDNFPRFIDITFQHPNPYYDDSYAVNSPNTGPYGDAIMQELIPYLESHFRIIGQPWARLLSGGSTGGWESFALQIYHPDFFGGTWTYCPDPLTFSDVGGADLYQDANVFYKQYEWRREPTLNSRTSDDGVNLTSEDRNRLELVYGTHGRAGAQYDIWEAVFGPIGQDGYFEPAWDHGTGTIDHRVTQYWSDSSDLLHYMQRHWPTLGPKLIGKLHVYVGDADTFYLNRDVRAVQAWLKTTSNPHYEGLFMYGEGKPHCWSGPVTTAQRHVEMAEYLLATKPEGATTPWWTY